MPTDAGAQGAIDFLKGIHEKLPPAHKEFIRQLFKLTDGEWPEEIKGKIHPTNVFGVELCTLIAWTEDKVIFSCEHDGEITAQWVPRHYKAVEIPSKPKVRFIKESDGG